MITGTRSATYSLREPLTLDMDTSLWQGLGLQEPEPALFIEGPYATKPDSYPELVVHVPAMKSHSAPNADISTRLRLGLQDVHEVHPYVQMGMDGPEHDDSHTEELYVEYILEAVRRMEPGPIVFSGISRGGRLALKVAQAALEDGDLSIAGLWLLVPQLDGDHFRDYTEVVKKVPTSCLVSTTDIFMDNEQVSRSLGGQATYNRVALKTEGGHAFDRTAYTKALLTYGHSFIAGAFGHEHPHFGEAETEELLRHSTQSQIQATLGKLTAKLNPEGGISRDSILDFLDLNFLGMPSRHMPEPVVTMIDRYTSTAEGSTVSLETFYEEFQMVINAIQKDIVLPPSLQPDMAGAMA